MALKIFTPNTLIKSSEVNANFENMYPVGSIYINASVATNPSTLFGFGTWVEFGKGRVLVGVDTGQTEFDTLGETGGAKTHTLSINEMPSHNHNQYANVGNAATGQTNLDDIAGCSNINASDVLVGNRSTTSTGGGAAHNNLQPYITVYMWQRTA